MKEKPKGRLPRTSSAGLKACWEADISTAMDVVIRLSDNDRYQSDQFIREVIRKLKPWGEPPNKDYGTPAR